MLSDHAGGVEADGGGDWSPGGIDDIATPFGG
jgi:hypothetical protein